MRAPLTTLFLWSIASYVSAQETVEAPVESLESQGSGFPGNGYGRQCTYGDDPSIIAHTGTPVGTTKTYQGGNKDASDPVTVLTPLNLLTYQYIATLYVSEPPCRNPTIGVVYLTDAFGIQFVNNKLYVLKKERQEIH